MNKITPHATPIYYRDLSPEMKFEVRGEMSPRLLLDIDNGNDVTIGYWLQPKDYHKD